MLRLQDWNKKSIRLATDPHPSCFDTFGEFDLKIPDLKIPIIEIDPLLTNIEANLEKINNLIQLILPDGAVERSVEVNSPKTYVSESGEWTVVDEPAEVISHPPCSLEDPNCPIPIPTCSPEDPTCPPVFQELPELERRVQELLKQREQNLLEQELLQQHLRDWVPYHQPPYYKIVP